MSTVEEGWMLAVVDLVLACLSILWVAWKRMEEREAARRQQPASGLGRPPDRSSEESRPSLASSLGRPGALS
jgi:hypothetical protein